MVAASPENQFTPLLYGLIRDEDYNEAIQILQVSPQYDIACLSHPKE